jgi:hypothetical protein
LHGGHRYLSAVALVEGNGRANVEVAYTISVGHTERVFVLEMVGDFLESSSGAGIISGVDQGYAPRLGNALMHLHPVLFQIESDVTHMQEVVREVLLDEISLITATNDEVVDSVLRIDFENVPQLLFVPLSHWCSYAQTPSLFSLGLATDWTTRIDAQLTRLSATQMLRGPAKMAKQAIIYREN